MDHFRLSSGDIASANPISNLPPATPVYQVPSAVLRKRRLSELEDTDAAMLPPKHNREGEVDSSYVGTETLSRNMPSFQCTHSAENGPDRCGPENTYEVQPGGRISYNLVATGDIAQGWCPDRNASLPLSGEVQSSNLQLSVSTVRQALPDQYMHQQPISPGLSGNFGTVASDEILCINPSILEKRVGEGNNAVSADGSGRSSILCDIWGSVYREVPGAQISLGHGEDLPSLTIPSDLEAGGKSGSSLHPALSMRAQNTSLPPDPGTGSGILANCSSNTTHPLLISQSTTPNCSLGSPDYSETYSRDSKRATILPARPRTDSCVKPLNIALMTHQVEGVTWMKSMEDSEWKGGILADDMGLGKTIQALSLVKSRICPDARTLPTLIVTPAGLIHQWERETENIFGSGQRVFVYYRRKGRLTFQDLCQYQVVLTTYGTICSELKQKASDSPIFGDGKAWQRIILDEAQCIKNARSKTAMACCEVAATYRWCLSGTPLMNHLGELCSLLKFLRIQPYVNTDSFNSILKSESIGRTNDPENARDMQLQGFLKTIMLRRTKWTTLNGKPIVQLPSITIEDVYVALTEEERCTYAVLESFTQRHVQRYLNNGGEQRKIPNVLSLLQYLRQACCHILLLSGAALTALQSSRSEEHLAANALCLPEEVVTRLRDNETIFQCPVCLERAYSPIIFSPCGHSVCLACFGRMCSTTAPEGASTEVPVGFRCHSCRVTVDLKKVTDYSSFVRSHNFSMSDQGSSTLFPSSLKALLGLNDEGDEDNEDSGSEVDVGLEACRTDHVIPPLRYGVAPSEVGSAGKQSSAAMRKHHEAKVAYRHALSRKWVNSSKIEKAVEIIKAIRDQGTGDKVIVFSHFTALLDLIEVPIASSGWKYRRYDGRMTPAERGSAISSFASQPDCLVLLVSLKAGNSGLNLACASNVIIMEPSWNPYIEEQAIGRVHRIGQERHVRVYRLLVADTIEIRILELQEKKRKLIRGFSNGAVMLGTDNLIRGDIAYIFGLDGGQAHA
ncbi:SWI/SNF family DNA-dependent ATPase [Aspergillus udagawae]|nr:SWI/SNF family DNA-dependent ATPase [Aspergillus udagawae]